MKRILRYIFFSIYICQLAYGQNDIQFRINGDGSGCYVNSMLVDAQNNTVVTGYYHKDKGGADTTGILEVNGRAYVLSGSYGAFIAKFNSRKEILWLKTTQRNTKNIYTGSHLLLDDSGNSYVIGRFQRVPLVDNGIGETFISKYSKDGILIWEKVLSGITDNGEFKPERDAQGNLYLIGKYQGDLKIDGTTLHSTQENKPESYLLKLNTNGSPIFSKSFPSELNLNAITINAANEVFVAGDFEADIQLETGYPIASVGLKDIFYAKYRTNGQIDWVKTINGQSDDECRHIKADKLGNIYLSGVVSNEALFNTKPITIAGEGRNIFLTKIKSTDGQVDWVRNMPFEGKSTYSERHRLVANLQISPDGSPYLFGVVSESLTINANTQLLPDFFPIYYLLKYEPDGDFVYGKKYSISDEFGFSYWNDMRLAANGQIYIVGVDVNYNRINGTYNDSSFLIEKNEIDACNGQPFKIEKSGNILRPVEPFIGVYNNDEPILLEENFTYQWYKNGERVPNGARKTIQPTGEGYYTLKLISKTDPTCTNTSANFVGVYSPAAGSSLLLMVDYSTNKLSTTPTMPGSILEWYQNKEVIDGQRATSINYQADGTYQVKEYFEGIIKESNELVINAGVAVEIIKETSFQLGDPCRPGPYLRCTFLSDIPVTYQWYFNGVPVKDSTNSHFNPVTTGEYYVSVHMPNRNRTYLSGKYVLLPSDFPKSLPIFRIDDACSGHALLKVDDAFMQKYQFKSIVWRLAGQDIPNETLPYYKATKSGYYTFSLKYQVDNKPGECTYNSFIDFTKNPFTDLNLGYAYAGSGCVVDSFKVFVEYNKDYNYSWTKNDTLLKNERSNELFINDKGVYKAIINKGDGCNRETNAVTLNGCTPNSSNQFLMLNPPVLTADKTTVFVNEQSFIRANGCSNVNFQWLKDTEPISGANQADFEIKQSGTYRLQIEKLGCTAVSEPIKIIVENLLSEEPGADLQIKVFPNPFNESVSIELPVWINKGTTVKLTDITGKLVKSWKVDATHTLELSELPDGVYLLSFEVDKKRVVRKVVKGG
jgi:hypothetical protein